MAESDIVERLMACTAGMAGALYVLAAALAWHRVFVPRPLENGRPGARKIILDRAVAWTAFAGMFFGLAAMKLRWVPWSSPELGYLLTGFNVVVFAAGLASVRAISVDTFGNSVVLFFVAVSAATGGALWVWG